MNTFFILLADLLLVHCLDASPPAISISKGSSTPIPRYQASVATHTRPTIATSMDINNDGLIDLVSANYYGNTVTILKNKGSLNFEFSQNVYVGGNPTQAIPVHLNADPAIDMVATVSAFVGSALVTLTNDGDGGFSVAQQLTMPIAPVAIASGDLNRDGSSDIVSVNYWDRNMSVLTNNGKGSLKISETIPTGPVPHGVVIDDVDHDGWMDIVICCFDSGLVQVFANDRTGHFILKQTIPIPGIPHWIAGGDFNGDGFTDVATSNERSYTFSILTNDHTGGFVHMATLPSTVNSYGIAAGDWDGDGLIDLVVSSLDETELAAVGFRNLGNARFEGPSWRVGKNVSYVPTLTRLDGGKKMYLVLAELLGDRLDIFSIEQGSVQLGWPSGSGSASWRLEDAQELAPNSWRSSTLPVIQNPLNGMSEVSLGIPGSARFFRLAQ